MGFLLCNTGIVTLTASSVCAFHTIGIPRIFDGNLPKPFVMNHVSRLFSLFCLLGAATAVQAQSTSAASGTATQVSQNASTASPYTKSTEEVTTTPETTAVDSPATAATAATTEAPAVAAATVTVKGKVLDEENKPLAGVVVYIKDAPVKDAAAIATTDANGEYSLEAPAGVNILTFSYAGYQEQQLSASNFLPTAVQLLPADNKKKLNRISRR